MSKVKKVLAIILSMAMILGMSLSTFAATNKTEIKIYGVEKETGVNVTAYQIIKYEERGEYVPVIENTITVTDNKLTPTASDVLALSERTDELGTGVTLVTKQGILNGETVTYYTTASGTTLAAGTWMIIVTGSNNYIYNPAIVSVSQTADGIEYGELNLSTDSWGDNIWLKKSEPTIEKTALTQNVQGVQYGDIIQFQIKTKIPSYATNKKNITYTISDTLDGLTLVVDSEHPVVATLDGVPNDTLTGFVNTGFTDKSTSASAVITGDEFIKNNGNKEIVITYWAKVTESAKVTVSELTNTATLTYSTGTGTSTKSDITNHYTFGIDTTFSGSVGTQDKTGEFIKIDENGNVSYTETPGEVTVTGGKPLSGAVFELHIGSATGDLFADASGATQFTTDSKGRLEIVGLDSDVNYYLVEKKAPQGYTINNTPVKVKIDANYDNDGILTGYSVVIGEGQNQATTNYNYSAQTGITTIIPGTSNPYGFKNSVLSSLPSTGGIGTTIFTIGGCVIMIAAAGLYFASRRKQESK